MPLGCSATMIMPCLAAAASTEARETFGPTWNTISVDTKRVSVTGGTPVNPTAPGSRRTGSRARTATILGPMRDSELAALDRRFRLRKLAAAGLDRLDPLAILDLVRAPLSLPVGPFGPLSFATRSFPVLSFAILSLPTLSFASLSLPILSFASLSFPILSFASLSLSHLVFGERALADLVLGDELVLCDELALVDLVLVENGLPVPLEPTSCLAFGSRSCLPFLARPGRAAALLAGYDLSLDLVLRLRGHILDDVEDGLRRSGVPSSKAKRQRAQDRERHRPDPDRSSGHLVPALPHSLAPCPDSIRPDCADFTVTGQGQRMPWKVGTGFPKGYAQTQNLDRPPLQPVGRVPENPLQLGRPDESSVHALVQRRRGVGGGLVGRFDHGLTAA